MSNKIIYNCDVCKKQIGEMPGPIFVEITSEMEPELNADLEVCSLKCLRQYTRQAKPPLRLVREGDIEDEPA